MQPSLGSSGPQQSSLVMRHPSQHQHAMLPMSEAEEAALGLGQSTLTSNNGNNAASASASNDHCPKHGGNSKNENSVCIDTKDLPGESSNQQPQILLPPGSSPSQGQTTGQNAGQGSSSGGGKKQDPKEIMKKRRERAICIDRVSRVIFPSTFILLNIIYWLVFSEILDAIKQSVGSEDH